MSRSYSYHLYCHLVWGTWRRLPLIDSAIESTIHASIIKKCHELGATPIAIGGVEDHIHLLVQFNPTHRIANLVKEIKGYSSHLVNHVEQTENRFGWQRGYGAFSVGFQEMPKIEKYIDKQKQHHFNGSLLSQYELDDSYQ